MPTAERLHCKARQTDNTHNIRLNAIRLFPFLKYIIIMKKRWKQSDKRSQRIKILWILKIDSDKKKEKVNDKEEWQRGEKKQINSCWILFSVEARELKPATTPAVTNDRCLFIDAETQVFNVKHCWKSARSVNNSLRFAVL